MLAFGFGSMDHMNDIYDCAVFGVLMIIGINNYFDWLLRTKNSNRTKNNYIMDMKYFLIYVRMVKRWMAKNK